MKFMCDEMREGLLAGKEYIAQNTDGHLDVYVYMDNVGDLMHRYSNGAIRAIMCRSDMLCEWEECRTFDIRFEEAMEHMCIGKVVQSNDETLYKLCPPSNGDEGLRMYEFYNGLWFATTSGVNRLFEKRWRIYTQPVEEVE